MAFTVEIPADLEKRLETEAAGHGLSAGEYVRALLERMLGNVLI
jgi:plasmid stability protein